MSLLSGLSHSHRFIIFTLCCVSVMHASLLRSPVGSGKDRGALLLHTQLLCWPVAPGGSSPRPPRPPRRVWTARQSRADAHLPPTLLGSCSHSRSRHAASSNFPAARVSPCAGAWRRRGSLSSPSSFPLGSSHPGHSPFLHQTPVTWLWLGSGGQRPHGKSTDVPGSVTATDPFLPGGTVGTGHTGLSHPSGDRARQEVALSPGNSLCSPRGPPAGSGSHRQSRWSPLSVRHARPLGWTPPKAGKRRTPRSTSLSWPRLDLQQHGSST